MKSFQQVSRHVRNQPITALGPMIVVVVGRDESFPSAALCRTNLGSIDSSLPNTEESQIKICPVEFNHAWNPMWISYRWINFQYISEKIKGYPSPITTQHQRSLLRTKLMFRSSDGHVLGVQHGTAPTPSSWFASINPFSPGNKTWKPHHESAWIHPCPCYFGAKSTDCWPKIHQRSALTASEAPKEKSACSSSWREWVNLWEGPVSTDFLDVKWKMFEEKVILNH